MLKYTNLCCPLSISTWFSKYRVSLDFFSISNSKKKSILKLDFFVEFELDFYCLCSLQKSSSNSKKKSSFEIDFFFEFEINSEIQNSKIKCRETGGELAYQMWHKIGNWWKSEVNFRWVSWASWPLHKQPKNK